jgi:hypothetical protein
MARQVLTIPDVPTTLLQKATADTLYAPVVHTHTGTYLPLTGGTLSGGLTLGGGNDLTLDGAAGTGRDIYARTGGLARWVVKMADESAESGSNAGSDLLLYRYNDAGGFLGSALTLTRATGAATFGGDVTTGGHLGVGGNLGAWGSGWRAVQVGGAGSVWTSGGAGAQLYLSSNSRFDGANRRALQADEGYEVGMIPTLGFRVATAPSVGAGATQTFTTRMALSQQGTLSLSPDAGQAGINAAGDITRTAVAGQHSQYTLDGAAGFYKVYKITEAGSLLWQWGCDGGNDFYLWRYPGGGNPIHISRTTGRVTINTPSSGAQALNVQHNVNVASGNFLDFNGISVGHWTEDDRQTHLQIAYAGGANGDWGSTIHFDDIHPYAGYPRNSVGALRVSQTAPGSNVSGRFTFFTGRGSDNTMQRNLWIEPHQICPGIDGATNLGAGSVRFGQIYSTVGSISTSTVEAKEIVGQMDDRRTLDELLAIPAIYRFHYKKPPTDAPPAKEGAPPDYSTWRVDTSMVFSGPVAEEVPPSWRITPTAMSDVNSIGHLMSAVRGLAGLVSEARARIAALEGAAA